MVGADPAGLAGEVNLFKSLVLELSDHFVSVDYLVYSVKRLWWGQRPSARGTNENGFPRLARKMRRMGHPAS
jgi:hypothetical protein